MVKIRQKERIDNSNALNLFSDRKVTPDPIPVCDCCHTPKPTTKDIDKDYFANLKTDRDKFIRTQSKPKNIPLKVILNGSGTSSRSKNEFLPQIDVNKPEKQAVEKKAKLTPTQDKARILEFKKAKADRKDFIGEKIKSVGNCGITPIDKHRKYYNLVQGEKGGYYYEQFQRCGSIWFCEDCGYKLLQERSEKVYNQLKAYKDAGKTILFVTFTIQHNITDRLETLIRKLNGAFNYANKHRRWQEAKKRVPVEFLRVLEVLYGKNGWHPHGHPVFVGDPEIIDTIHIFIELYKKRLAKQGLLVNEHTVDIAKWNGDLESMSEYMFKGMLEKELLGGSFKKDNKGKTFFELVDGQVKREKNRTEDQNAELQHKEHRIIDEYIRVMKSRKQWFKSDNFFAPGVDIKSDEEVLKDDKVKEIIYTIPSVVMADIRSKRIARRLPYEHWYGGRDSVLKLLEMYDVNTDFIVHNYNLRDQAIRDWIAISTVKYAYVGDRLSRCA